MTSHDLPSSEEIARNLRKVSELRILCLSLSAAGRAAGFHSRPLTAPPLGGEPVPPEDEATE